MKTNLTVILLVHGFLLHAVSAANWPAWRGPDADGAAEAGSYPSSFSTSQGMLWTVDLPGRGASTPVVWGDQIFLTADVDSEDTALCYDVAGKELWRKTLGQTRAGRNRVATGSNPSPVTDGEQVYVYFKSGNLAALGMDGEIVWQKNLQEAYGQDILQWDLGTSPVLSREAVVVAVMQRRGSYLVALDRASGEEKWKTDRTLDAPDESNDAYTTPLIVRDQGKEIILTWGADHLTAHDAATGEALWICGGFNPDSRRNWRTIASAAVQDDVVVVPYGRGGLLAGVRVGGSGDISDSAKIWDREVQGPDVPTPVIHDGKVILLSDRGALTCVDLKTGRDLWTSSLPRAQPKYYASPLLVGDQLYCARQDGTVFVGKVSDSGFELLAENSLQDQMVASPVPVNGRMLLRGNTKLFCVGTN